MPSTGPSAGFKCAVVAYVLWGVLPLYWKLLKGVPAFEVLCNRTLWSLLFVLLLLQCRGELRTACLKLKSARAFGTCLLSGLFLSANWLTFIWAVQHGFVLECSLGYFITPILNVLIGLLIFGERLSPLRWCAVLLAAATVVNQAFSYGRFPWIALTLAATFAIYGLIRKKSVFKSLEGLMAETLLMSPLALAAYGWFANQHGSSLFAGSSADALLLIASGPVTAVPLLFFARGARDIPMTTLGLLQYIAPSLQFLLAVFAFHEAFSFTQLCSFVLIWLALFLYSFETLPFRNFDNCNRKFC